MSIRLSRTRGHGSMHGRGRRVSILTPSARAATALTSACKAGQASVVRRLLEAAGSRDISTVLDAEGASAIHAAAEGGSVEVLQVLLDARAGRAEQQFVAQEAAPLLPVHDEKASHDGSKDEAGAIPASGAASSPRVDGAENNGRERGGVSSRKDEDATVQEGATPASSPPVPLLRGGSSLSDLSDLGPRRASGSLPPVSPHGFVRRSRPGKLRPLASPRDSPSPSPRRGDKSTKRSKGRKGRRSERKLELSPPSSAEDTEHGGLGSPLTPTRRVSVLSRYKPLPPSPSSPSDSPRGWGDDKAPESVVTPRAGEPSCHASADDERKEAAVASARAARAAALEQARRQSILELCATKDARGATPLNVAATWGSVRTSAMLLGCGASANAVSANGRTPLHDAADAGHHALLTTLGAADINADPLLVDETGQTALDITQAWGWREFGTKLERYHKTWFRRLAVLILAAANRETNRFGYLSEQTLLRLLRFLGPVTVPVEEVHVANHARRRMADASFIPTAPSDFPPPVVTDAAPATTVYVKPSAPRRCSPVVLHELESCRAAVKRIPRYMIEELRTLRNPPESVRLVMRAVCVACFAGRDTATTAPSGAGGGAGAGGESAPTATGTRVVQVRPGGLGRRKVFRIADKLARETTQPRGGRDTYDGVRFVFQQPLLIESMVELEPRILPAHVAAAMEALVAHRTFAVAAVTRASRACLPLRDWVLAQLAAHHSLTQAPVAQDVGSQPASSEPEAVVVGRGAVTASMPDPDDPVFAKETKLDSDQRGGVTGASDGEPQASSKAARTGDKPLEVSTSESKHAAGIPALHDALADADEFELQMLRFHLIEVLQKIDIAGGALPSYKALRRAVASRVGRDDLHTKTWRKWFKAEINAQLDEILHA